MDSVFYLFKPNREADFLKDLLKEFKGVLVSDFYPGYDSINCLQQKCLIHLIRDLNNDFFKNQLDTEFKNIVINFGQLLRKIVETINRYGLKKRHLNKHENDVINFYTHIINRDYESELAISYQKRFKKNRYKLFTFLEHDGIPWNNNNAEHAITFFGLYRRTAQVLNIVNKSEKGVDAATLVKETGFNQKKVTNIIQRTLKLGKITRLEKGIYVGVK